MSVSDGRNAEAGEVVRNVSLRSGIVRGLSCVIEKLMGARRAPTLVERRMAQISAKQIAKQHKPDYKFVRGLWESTQAATPWGNYYGLDQWPPVASYQTINVNDFIVHEIAKCGGYLDSDISGQMVNPGGMEPRDMYINLKSIQADFRFINQGSATVVVDMQITRFGYDKSAAYFAAAVIPQLIPQPIYTDHRPFTSPNTLNGQFTKAYKEPDSQVGLPHRSFQVLARKRIVLRPSRMIDDPTGGVNAARVNTSVFHKLKLNKFWKKAGRRERYKILGGAQEGPEAPVLRGSLLDHRYFFSIRVTGTVGYVGVTSVKFCAGGLLDRQMIFDRAAAGLAPGG